MAEILEVPDDLLDQLMTQFESNNNHDTSNNDDVDVVDDGLQFCGSVLQLMLLMHW